MNKQEWFTIPYMRLCRADIKNKEEMEDLELTDETMQRIANKISKIFMEDWATALNEATITVLEEHNERNN